MYTGNLVRMRAVTRDDLPRYVHWFNDPEVTQYLTFIGPASLEAEQKWFESIAGNANTHVFAIETLAGEHIGGMGIHDLRPRDRSASVGILIGEKKYWQRGYGTDAMRVLLRYGFDTLNLHRIWLNVFAENERAKRTYLKCGFQQEGILRHDLYKNGKYNDIIVMSILEDEYRISMGERK